MSFYAHFIDDTGRTWNVSSKGNSVLTDDELSKMEYLQADGDELDYIKSQYAQHYDWETRPDKVYNTMMPGRKAPRVMRWYGDIGRTIAFNL
jgi:hypothetical protein